MIALQTQDEALSLEDIAYGLSWTEEKTREILEITDKDGTTTQPDTGTWRLT